MRKGLRTRGNALEGMVIAFMFGLCGIAVSTVGITREGIDGAGDGIQRPLRSRFQPRLMSSVRLQRIRRNL